MNTSILGLATFLYLGAFTLYLLSLIMDRTAPRKLGLWLTTITFSLHSAGILLRWIESYRLGFGHVPLANFYESLIFFAWAIILMHLYLETSGRARNLGSFTCLGAFLMMAYASFAPNISSQIQPLIPALKSNWLTTHVLTCFLGYAAFFISAILGMLYLLKDSSRFMPPAQTLDELLYHSVTFGFILFTIGIMTGAVWAYSAWGRYWGWDPKETWALITWLIYAALLHKRFQPGAQRASAWMSILGLLSVLFTYFGVNYLPGLHSYL